jgi:hypothetical protein
MSSTLAPSRAADIAAVQPPGPPPTTITSQRSSTGIFLFDRVNEGSSFADKLPAPAMVPMASKPPFLKNSLLLFMIIYYFMDKKL